MAGVNKVILVGNLGADPEARSLNNGGEVVNLRVATSEQWKDRDGNRQERTEWHQVVIFNENLGRVAKSYLKKGSKVYLEGQLQTRKWTDQSGNDKYTTEIVLQRFRGELVLLDSRGEGGGSGGGFGGGGYGDDYGGGSSGGGSQRQQSRPQPAAFDNDLDDAVPFLDLALLGLFGVAPLQLGKRGERPRLLFAQHAGFLEGRFGAGAARVGIHAQRQRVGDRAAEVDRGSVVEDDVAILGTQIHLVVRCA